MKRCLFTVLRTMRDGTKTSEKIDGIFGTMVDKVHKGRLGSSAAMLVKVSAKNSGEGVVQIKVEASGDGSRTHKEDSAFYLDNKKQLKRRNPRQLKLFD